MNSSFENSPFDPASQDIDSKVIVTLERLSEAFRVALWQEAKDLGLSPIQIQILIFLLYHRAEQRKVSYLAREFNLTKPTISDAVRVLEVKGLIQKTAEPGDSRSYSMALTETGRLVAERTAHFANVFRSSLTKLGEAEKQVLYHGLLSLIDGLHQRGIIMQQRMCSNCRFNSGTLQEPYCTLLQKKLQTADLQIDCPEHQMAF
jgi:DNA-binding MarR family transcriptional regulator